MKIVVERMNKNIVRNQGVAINKRIKYVSIYCLCDDMKITLNAYKNLRRGTNCCEIEKIFFCGEFCLMI